MSDGPAFLVADPGHPAWRSPLARALADAPAGIRDVSVEATDGPVGRAGGTAGIEIEGPPVRALLARLTDVEPPAVCALAHVRVQITVEGTDRYRIWCPQEYGDHVAHVVLDVWQGLAP